jgi:hypothetical protein
MTRRPGRLIAPHPDSDDATGQLERSGGLN